MRIEKHKGNLIVCGYIFSSDKIEIGSKWQSSSGNVVTVYKVEEDSVFYSWIENGKEKYHCKTCFSFQCRYCLIVSELDTAVEKLLNNRSG
jgi:hypothetical protein